MPQFNKGKPEDVKLEPVGLANTRISTGYAQKSPQLLLNAVLRSGSRVVRDPSLIECIHRDRGGFWAQSVEIPVFANPTGYRLVFLY